MKIVSLRTCLEFPFYSPGEEVLIAKIYLQAASRKHNGFFQNMIGKKVISQPLWSTVPSILLFVIFQLTSPLSDPLTSHFFSFW